MLGLQNVPLTFKVQNKSKSKLVTTNSNQVYFW